MDELVRCLLQGRYGCGKSVISLGGVIESDGVCLGYWVIILRINGGVSIHQDGGSSTK